ncbi:glycoside hydrolase [Dendrothele bispora CBS 962.96]|uniref:Glycoside hydrolase n=1 Tax=Dendrothele bispora (strain CBS 962.96) TaxID=1314807 RepID=A0A4S8LUR8_DENBC|nr:glycoside hydrolase [Dendrothele bispora CBS 962.96]
MFTQIACLLLYVQVSLGAATSGSLLSSPTTVSPSTHSSSTASITISVPTSTATPNPGGASFPPVGSITRNFSPTGLDQLWNVVGPVESPPFTTTVEPQTPVILPSPPPTLYPSFYANRPKDILSDYKYPKGFIFGLDTAAYQVEGATKEEGKGPSMWDWASRQPGAIADNSTADIADLQYYLYKEDVARVAALGVKAHSFSISWARILPFGTADSPVNQQGIDHYADLIQYHLKSGVEPIATLFHWDTPLALQAYYGGFTSGQIVDDFVHYAKTVFAAYNGTVKTWFTFNEPRVFCGQVASYPFNITYAPGVNTSTAPYQCSYNLIHAHAGAVKAFREMNIVGEIAFKSDDFVGTPWRKNTTDDAAAVERHGAFQIGVFADPIYTTGDWPTILKDTLPPEYLPRFTEEEKREILGSADFFAIDAYRSQYISAPDEGLDACLSNGPSDPEWPQCNTIREFDSNAMWAVGASADVGAPWLQDTSRFFRDAMKEIHRRWPTQKIYVTEFGFAQPFENERTELYRIKEDTDRTNYLMSYLGEMLLSIHEDHIPIMGAFIWSMVDNAEWGQGLSTRFGVQYVNYTTLERTYKRSALALSEFFEAHLQ